jgi:hypothetical protein
VLQFVFPDAAYDVYNASYFSNFELRILTSILFPAMTFAVSLLIQGLFVAVGAHNLFLNTLETRLYRRELLVPQYSTLVTYAPLPCDTPPAGFAAQRCRLQ